MFWLRSLLIIALSVFAAPRVMAADGIAAVLCAGDGSRRVVILDVETGAPLDAQVIFATCDQCLTPPLAPAPEGVATPRRLDAPERVPASAQAIICALPTPVATARAPPLI